MTNERIYAEPVGLLTGSVAIRAEESGRALRLAGGWAAFSAVALHRRGLPLEILPVDRVDPALLAPLVKSPADFAGLTLERPRIMGIVNVTPDSFSDGGETSEADRAIARAHELVEAGADIIDVGGESTRPGSKPVTADEEWRRVEPVVRQLAEDGLIVSIDTRHALVMEKALEAGAAILNDVSALSHDPRSLSVAVASKAPMFLMHMRGEPETMNQAPRYDDPALDVYDELAERLRACLDAGIDPALICLDPGIGFAKHAPHNLAILGHLALYHHLGCPLLLGVSRKGLIARTDPSQPVRQRIGSSLAGGLSGIAAGMQFLRVHDVYDTQQAVAVWQAIHAT
jgi:dihydropteroate synthase